MRKILFASERVNTSSSETFYFIGLLVIFALVASAVVLYAAIGDVTRNRFQLVLHCIMIITSVVPPELPMELSLAVTYSLGMLSKLLVFCTEPFRIPFGGRLGVLCFDKTGTLTQDKMLFRGVVMTSELTDNLLEENKSGSDAAKHRDLFEEVLSRQVLDKTAAITSIESEMSHVSGLAVAVMASCHSLFRDPRTGLVTGCRHLTCGYIILNNQHGE